MLWFLDDGSAYVIDNKPADPDSPVVRSPKIANIINIETVSVHSLRIKLYALNPDEDTDITLEIGETYDIMYITEGGLKVARGTLKLIDTTIPDTCVRYIGEFNETVNTAWIGLDCSTEGHSDKRKIYIASIRAIQKVENEDDYTPLETSYDDLSVTGKLNVILDLLPGMDNKLSQIISNLYKHDRDIKAKLNNMTCAEKLQYIIDNLCPETETENSTTTTEREPSNPIILNGDA